MHKRAPLLRPRKTQNGSSSSTSSASMPTSPLPTTTAGPIRGKKGSKSGGMTKVWIGLLLFIFGACVYVDRSMSNGGGGNSGGGNSSTAKNNNIVTPTSPVIKAPANGSTTTADDADTDADEKDNNDDEGNNNGGDDYNPNYHLIFSTDCSAFQHWQSYLLFHSALKVGQPGTVTRIASGCSDEEAVKEQKWHDENVASTMSTNFKLHLTPHFSGVKDENGETVGDYKFFNKPFGLKHWLENAIGFEDDGDSESKNIAHKDDVVILIDPDMILLRPITGDFSHKRDVIVGKRHEKEQKYFVKHGSPIAQKYGFGAQWTKLDLEEIAGANTPAKISNWDAGTFYPAGPPYLATVGDMYQIALNWAGFVPAVHKQHPHLMAEMFAFCIAAAHLELKHQIVDSLMISNVGVGGEGWPMVDNIPEDEEESLCEFASHPDHSKYPVPSVIHYCQRYAIGDWFFGKRKMVKSFFECESPLMEFPPTDIIETKDYKHIFNDKRKPLSKEMARREGFMVCGVLSALNDAGRFFKEHSCKGVENTSIEEGINLNHN